MVARGNSLDDVCWICLDGHEDGRKLVNPCKCPRKVHSECMARWQLQQAGKEEEKFCRFCKVSLMDWKDSLTPQELKPEVSKVQPIMVVYFEGEIHRIPVKQGTDGLNEFTTKIRTLFNLPEDVDISLTFGCKEPMSGSQLKLEGMGAFDAAVHCASVAAADRQQRIKKSYSTSNLSSRVAAANAARTTAAPGAGAAAAGAAITPPPPASGGANGGTAEAASAARRARLADREEARRRCRSFVINRNSSASPQASYLRGLLNMLATRPGGAAGPSGIAVSPRDGPAPGSSSVDGCPPSRPPRPARHASMSQVSAAPTAPAATAADSPRSARDSRLRATSSLSQIPDEMVARPPSCRSDADVEVDAEGDSAVSVGSGLPNKLKLQLKALSRRVARSISFRSHAVDACSSAGTSPAASPRELSSPSPAVLSPNFPLPAPAAALPVPPLASITAA